MSAGQDEPTPDAGAPASVPPPAPPLPQTTAQAAASAPPLPPTTAQVAASAPPRPPSAPAVEPPSPDVAQVEAESAIPGKHRGGFARWPTAPVGVVPISTAPDLDAPVQWAPVEPATPSRGMAAWALGFAITALIISMFVGWGFPIGLVAIVTAIIALRRPLESRAVAVWAIVLGVVSLLYSAGWLWFAASRTDLLG